VSGGRRIALAALLCAAAPACKGKKKEEPKAQPAAHAEATSRSAAKPPNLPDKLAFDCARIVPEAVRSAQLPSTEVAPTIVGPIATCVFKPPGEKSGPSVSLFCHQRRHNWDFSAELAHDSHKTAIKGLGRDAYLRGDHVFFYPAKLDCLARVIWPNDPAKATALAKAVEPNLSKATVSPAPSP
jgi:hypothetical protein